MITYHLIPEEWYPVLVLSKDAVIFNSKETAAEFSEEEIAEIKRVSAEFVALQKKLAQKLQRKIFPNALIIEDDNE